MGQTAIWSFADIYLNKSVGRSVREMLEALEDPEKSGKYKTINTITPLLVPIAGIDHLVGAVDNVWRRVPSGTFFEQMTDQFKKRVPWMSKELLPSIGFFGEENYRNGFIMGMLGYREGDPNAELAQELYANDVFMAGASAPTTVAG